MGVKRYIAANTEANVIEAFLDMYGKHDLPSEGKEVLNVGSDISFIANSFPELVKSVGCGRPENKLPWSVRNTNQVAFRAELRRSTGDFEDRYLAICWESYNKDNKDPTKYRLIYKTNYPQFLKERNVR